MEKPEKLNMNDKSIPAIEGLALYSCQMATFGIVYLTYTADNFEGMARYLNFKPYSKEFHYAKLFCN